MLEKADEEVTRWVESVLPNARVTLGHPVADSGEPVVCLHLLEVADMPPARGLAQTPLQACARYVVTTAAPDVRTEHELIGSLLFAAMAEPEMEVRFDRLPPELWTALGIVPRVAFVLGVRVRLDRREARAPSVLRPLVIRGAPLGPLEGLVLGPGDAPVADAFIRLPSLAVTTRSDHRGRFRFATVPTDARVHLLVRAKASEFPFTVAIPPDSEPVVLRLSLNEG